MCGIAGFLNLNGAPAAKSVVTRMARALAHRGPDGEGIWTENTVGFGHRRLAIIDLSPAAAQPMTSADGRFVMIYNGEVYNFRQLRAELEARGRRFRSTSDSEVVLEAFALWGVAAIERFNGMFALVIWDRREHRLTLARDRYGIKPIYHARKGGVFLFASEIKGLLAHGAFSAEIDLEGLAEYFAFQNFFTERTLFSSVSLLPPGTIMEIDAGGHAQTRRYWDFCFSDTETASAQELGDTLDRAFFTAVERQLVSDVPIGSYLSGGMDTGAI